MARDRSQKGATSVMRKELLPAPPVEFTIVTTREVAEKVAHILARNLGDPQVADFYGATADVLGWGM